jgi:hypothetical protein
MLAVGLELPTVSVIDLPALATSATAVLILLSHVSPTESHKDVKDIMAPKLEPGKKEMHLLDVGSEVLMACRQGRDRKA